jgi:hypothetical protein
MKLPIGIHGGLVAWLLCQFPDLIDILLNTHRCTPTALGRPDRWVARSSTGSPVDEFPRSGEFEIHNLTGCLVRAEPDASRRETTVNDIESVELVKRQADLKGKTKSAERMCALSAMERDLQIHAVEPD